MNDASPHKHIYGEPELVQITNVQANYRGATGDKSFLMHSCECGKKQAFDYGKTSDMKIKIEPNRFEKA